MGSGSDLPQHAGRRSAPPFRKPMPAHRPFFSVFVSGKNEPLKAPFQRRRSSFSRSPSASTRKRRQARVADTVVEADPVDPGGSPPGVSIAEVDAPQGRVRRGDELGGMDHRVALLLLAGSLPLAIDPDVEDHRVIKGRHRGRLRPRTDQRQHGQSNFRPHDVKTGIGRRKPQVAEIKRKANVTIMIHNRQFTCFNDQPNVNCVQLNNLERLCACCSLIFYLSQAAFLPSSF